VPKNFAQDIVVAADILGVPRNTISRIDRQGEIIKRYKLGHKTFVYDLESLQAFLDAALVRPTQSAAVHRKFSGREKSKVSLPSEEASKLREFLRQTLSELKENAARKDDRERPK